MERRERDNQCCPHESTRQILCRPRVFVVLSMPESIMRCPGMVQICTRILHVDSSRTESGPGTGCYLQAFPGIPHPASTQSRTSVAMARFKSYRFAAGAVLRAVCSSGPTCGLRLWKPRPHGGLSTATLTSIHFNTPQHGRCTWLDEWQSIYCRSPRHHEDTGRAAALVVPGSDFRRRSQVLRQTRLRR